MPISIAGVSDEESLEGLYRDAGLLPTDTNWSPYPSKLLFLLDALDNMPRLRVSAGLMNVILWLLREAGICGVPTMSMFRKLQESLRKDKGLERIHWMSPKGNTYSFNNPINIIANVSTARPNYLQPEAY
jgi:hypothetical protein